MLISVVVPFYREIELIGRAVASVFSQAKKADADISFEILIGNDGKYTSAEIMAGIDRDNNGAVQVIQNVGPRGPGGARNTCLRESNGELIAFLDADDFWMDSKLSLQLPLINQGSTFVASGYLLEGSDASIVPPSSIEKSIDIFRKRGIGTSTVLVHKELCRDKYFRDLRFSQDIDFWYRLAQAPCFKYGAVSAPSVVYSRGGSTRNKFVQLNSFYQVLKLNQIPWSERTSIIAGYAANGLVNHYLRRR